MTEQMATPEDRLGFTLFLALAVHALIIFGIGVSRVMPSAPSSPLEVTLVSNPDQKAPQQADFIAQENQQGSGSIDEVRELTSDQHSAYQDTQANEVNLTPLSVRRPSTQAQLIITSIGMTPQSAVSDTFTDNTRPDLPLPAADIDNITPPTDDIATLEARLAQQKQAYAKRPRINFVDSASAIASFEAQYINSFRQEVEAMGTRNFPPQALANHIFGKVRLRVDIDADGQVRDIKLLHSSGHELLDKAAINSVHLASPFAPFTRTMRQHYDVLAIHRTWQFDLSSTLTSSYDD